MKSAVFSNPLSRPPQQLVTRQPVTRTCSADHFKPCRLLEIKLGNRLDERDDSRRLLHTRLWR